MEYCYSISKAYQIHMLAVNGDSVMDNEKGLGVKGAWLNRAIFSWLKTL